MPLARPQPGHPEARTNGGCDSLQVRFQAVVTRHLHDGATLGGGWHPEWVSLTLHDEHGDSHRVELVHAACRVERGRVPAVETRGKARREHRPLRRCGRRPALPRIGRRREAATRAARPRAGSRLLPTTQRRAVAPARGSGGLRHGRAARRARRSPLPLAQRRSPPPGLEKPRLPQPRGRAPSAARGSAAGCTWALARPCGVSNSNAATR